MSKANRADRTDRAILHVLTEHPSATIVAIAEATGLARNTVRSRLIRYEEQGILLPFERRIDPSFLGFPLRAYIVATVTQRQLSAIGDELSSIEEVLEVQGLSGMNDLLIEVVARDAEDLYRVAARILAIAGVERTVTELVMRQLVSHRVSQLLHIDTH